MLAVQHSLKRWARYYGVSLRLVRALAWMESGFRWNAKSSAGAWGALQVTPGTWRYVENFIIAHNVPRTLDGGVRVGVAYLHQLLHEFRFNVRKALGAYYQGALRGPQARPLPRDAAVRAKRARPQKPVQLRLGLDLARLAAVEDPGEEEQSGRQDDKRPEDAPGDDRAAEQEDHDQRNDAAGEDYTCQPSVEACAEAFLFIGQAPSICGKSRRSIWRKYPAEVRLGQIEVERVEELDGRARRVDRHVGGHVQERLRVVEDDLDAGLDDVVGHLLGGVGRNREDGDDDVLLANERPRLGVIADDGVADRLADLVRSTSKAAAMLKPWSAKIVELAIAWPRRPAPKRPMLCWPCVRRILRISATSASML